MRSVAAAAVALVTAATSAACGQASPKPAESYTSTPSAVVRLDATRVLVRFASVGDEEPTGFELVAGSPARLRIRMHRPPDAVEPAGTIDGPLLAERCGVLRIPAAVQLRERNRRFKGALQSDCHEALPPLTVR